VVNAPSSISFLLNENIVQSQDLPARLVLDWLRRNRHLTGTKEGCKEGDCGSCTVIVGSLQEDGSVFYQPMTSCLLPLADLNGKHLVTIEGLNLEDLSPIQKAMVECGGTQCGYCTPGFIVSLTAGLLDVTSLMQAAEVMCEHGIGCLVVEPLEHGGGGFVTERDVLYAFAAHGQKAAELPVSAVMSRPVIAMPEDSFLYRALGLMARSGVLTVGVSVLTAPTEESDASRFAVASD